MVLSLAQKGGGALAGGRWASGCSAKRGSIGPALGGGSATVGPDRALARRPPADYPVRGFMITRFVAS
jgi:hypothetical protein